MTEKPRGSTTAGSRLDEVLAGERRAREKSARGYRERALRMYAWVCGRCAREFTHSNLQLLEVHHRDHNHDNNPSDGSNWELLCTYCHENEHRRFLDNVSLAGGTSTTTKLSSSATHQPFAGLGERLKKNMPR